MFTSYMEVINHNTGHMQVVDELTDELFLLPENEINHSEKIH